MSLPCFSFAASSSLNWKYGLSRLSAPPFSQSEYKSLTWYYSPWVFQHSHALWGHWVLCSWGIVNADVNGCQGTGDIQIVQSLLKFIRCCSIGLHFQNMSSEIKLIRISRWLHQSMKTRAPLSTGPSANYKDCTWQPCNEGPCDTAFQSVVVAHLWIVTHWW